MIACEDSQTIGDFHDFNQCVSAFQACRFQATGDIQFRNDRCLIGFDADDPTLPGAHFEAVVRIQYHEVRRLVRCPIGLTIQQFLERGGVQWHGERSLRFRGKEVCEQFLIEGGGILEINDEFGTPPEEEISPTIPFTVCQESESSGDVHDSRRRRHDATQSGTQVICRVWNQTTLVAEFNVSEESVANLAREGDTLDLQIFQDPQNTVQLFLEGCIGPVRSICATTDTTLGQAILDICQEDPSQYKVHIGVRFLDLDQSLAQLRLRNHDTISITSRNRGGGKPGSGSKEEGPEKKQKRPQRTPQKPSLENLTLAAGSFRLASGEHATIGGTFCISGHGVFTTPPCDYATILKGKSPLVPQELGLLVLSKPMETEVPCREVEFAACDQSGNGLLLQGWLLQFGKRHIQQGKVKDLQLPLEDTKTLAITAFRDEWQEKQAAWSDLVRGPAKVVIETFALDTTGIYEVWGRSWRKNNKPTQPDLAFSFRLWIKVKSVLTKEPLAKSGLTFPPFYVEDKQSNDKSPIQNKFYRILWIPRDMPPSDAISKIQQHHGLIRGRTGRGIRLQNDEFEKAFPIFYPGRTTPEEITANFHWLLLGAPGSADLEAIGTFLKDAGIKGKPLRKQGQNWKICTEEKLSEVQYSINGKNVLFQMLPSYTSTPNTQTLMANMENLLKGFPSQSRGPDHQQPAKRAKNPSDNDMEDDM